MKPRLVLALLCLPAALACPDDSLVELQNQPPQARIDAPGQVERDSDLSLSGERSQDPDGSIVSFVWDLGDGSSAEGETIEHRYDSAGSYTLALVVTDDQGASDEVSARVEVLEPNEPPWAEISGPSSGLVGQELSFDASGSSDSDGVIVVYEWRFGDGGGAQTEQARHAFAQVGTFAVRLTVFDDRGASDSVEHQVEIEDPVVDYSGTWSWTLVDESQRDLGLVCGSFEDSTLLIVSSPPSITITEQAGIVSVDYSGSIDGADFDVSNSGMTSTQRIWGTFTSATRFDGWYGIDPGLGSTTCADRAVVGSKQ